MTTTIILKKEEVTLLDNAMKLCEQILNECPVGQKFDSLLENAENAQYSLHNLLKDYNELRNNED